MLIRAKRLFQGFRHEDEDHRDEHYENSDGSIPTSRETIIYNRDGAIRGQYALYDLLSLHTMSGSIAVVIDPQPADPDHPTKPAKVLLSTRSGSISVHFRLPKGIRANEPADLDNDSNSKWTTYYSKQSTSLAPRPYSIDIQTQSGSITADIAFSTDAQLSTSSGNINARLTPLVFHGAKYIHGHKNVSIITDTKSGSTDLKLTEPLIFPAPSKREGEDGAIEQPQVAELRSTSASGAIRVMYPPSWAGHVYAVSVGSGRTRVGGRGLRIIKQGRNAVEGVKEPNKKLPKGKQWWGSKGDSNVQLEAKSGAVEFWVKDD